MSGHTNFIQKIGGALKGTGIIGSLVGGGLSLLGNHINAKRRRKAEERQRQWNQEDWQRVNEYNTPQAQMQRYKDAGLNPNLIYGQGTSSNASAVQPTSVEHEQFKLGADSILNQYYNLEQHRAGMDKIREETRKVKLQNDRNAIINLAEQDLIPKQLREQYEQMLVQGQLQDIEINNKKGEQTYWHTQAPNKIIDTELGHDVSGSVYKAQYAHTIQKAAMAEVKARTEDITVRNNVRKALESFLKTMPAGTDWQIIKMGMRMIFEKWIK